MGKNRGAEKTESSLWEALGKGLRLSLAAELFWYAAVCMLKDVFPDWTCSQEARRWTAALIPLTVFLYVLLLDRLQGRLRLLRLAPLPVCVWAGARYFQSNRETLLPGAEALGGQYIKRLNVQLQTSYPVHSGRPLYLETAYAFFLLAAVMALLLLLLLTGKRIFAVLLPLTALCMDLLAGLGPEWEGLALFFVGVCLLWGGGWEKSLLQVRRRTAPGASGSGEAGVRSPGPGRPLREALGRALLSLGPVLAAGVILLLCQKLLTPLAGKLLESAPEMLAFQKNLEQDIRTFSFSAFAADWETVNNQVPQYKGREVLELTASREPDTNLYLRAFYGTRYERGQWTYDQGDFEKACRKAGFSAQEVSLGLVRLGYESLGGGIASPASYTLRYRGVTNQYAYLPYFVDWESLEGGEAAGEGGVEKGRLRRSREFRGRSRNVGLERSWENLSQGEADWLSWYNAYVRETCLETSDRVPAVGEWLRDGRYRDLLAAQRLQASAQNAALRSKARLELARTVAEILAENMVYSMELERIRDGSDPVQFFLEESGRGYCKHFASAGVLMLRQLGVPARYASGYVAEKGAFQRQGSVFTLSVKDDRAHAWVEVYLDNVGWVPCEMTPAYNGMAAQTRPGTPQGAGPSPEPQQGQPSPSPQPDSPEEPWESPLPEGTAQPEGTPEPEGLGEPLGEPLGDAQGEALGDAQGEDTPSGTEPEGGLSSWGQDGAWPGGGGGEGAGDTGAGNPNRQESLTGGESSDRGESAGSEKSPEAVSWLVFLVLRAVCTLALLAGGFLLALGGALGYRLARHLRYQYRAAVARELAQGQNRKAIFRMNRRLYRRLRMRGGLPAAVGSDARYGECLMRGYPQAGREEWLRYMRILQEAAFARKEPSGEDAAFCYQIYRRCEERGGSRKIRKGY